MFDPEAIRKLLPEDDVDYLIEKGIDADVEKVGNDVHVVIHNYVLPDAYQPTTVDLRVILPSGYPNSTPDMFWTFPWVKVAKTNGDPAASSEPATFDGQRWQRWSRHYQSGWRPSDGLRTYLAAIKTELSLGK